MDDYKILIVSHLPSDFDDKDCDELLKHFGAIHVRWMGNKGHMKNKAFATFESRETAAVALKRLHQLELLGTRLIVQFSTANLAKYHPSELEEVKIKPVLKPEVPSTQSTDVITSKGKETIKERKRQIVERINSLSSSWNIEYPFNPKLQYMYPAPTITILTNIANAMATVPKFYVQVLHLMNKMNLPAPFGLLTCTPPVPNGVQPPLPPDLVTPPEPKQDVEGSTSEESEIESEGELEKKDALAGTKRRHKNTKKSRRKKLKLQLQMDAQMQAIVGIMPKSNVGVQQPTDVFDQKEQQVAPKKIEFKITTDSTNILPESDKEASKTVNAVTELNTVEVGGFGKIQPEQKPKESTNNKNDDMELGKQVFISNDELMEGRLPENDLKELAVFKNYEPGEATTRLYIKNLAKHVTEKDLHYVFGNYVDWENENEKIMYYIRLMKEGRMKGQAFVQLPNEGKAKAALTDSNGFLLHGKPMVVQFARSAKLKDNNVTSK